MTTAVLIISIITLLLILLSALDLHFGIKRMRHLSSVVPTQGGAVPKVSLIMPACNEVDNIERAIRSQLSQDYENLEIIVINDRSTDGTGDLLEQMKKRYPRLKVIHIEQLPAGWMGKANALQCGAEAALGEYLLFTDGDSIMEKTTIARALSYMEQEQLDHLTLIFRNISPGFLLNSLILESGAGLIQMLRPWRARNNVDSFVGVGAFNMIKKSVYTAIGKHGQIRMHPIDDIMLGKKVKEAGGSQECLLGVDLVSVPWYRSVGDMVNGLMKNVLAIINYRFTLLPPLLLLMFFLNVAPLWGAMLSGGAARLVFIAIVCIKLAAFFIGTRLLTISPWCAVGTIITPYITIYILLRAAWFNHRDNGIIWRGTHYPLSALKKNEPLFF